MNNKNIVINFFFIIILCISILISIICIFKIENFSEIENKSKIICSNGLKCPPGYKNCITIPPPGPGPDPGPGPGPDPGPDPGPGPSGHNFLTKLISDLTNRSIVNITPSKQYSDLSGIIIIKPGDSVKNKLQFMLDEWNELTMPSQTYVDGTVNTAIQNAIYPYNTNTTYYKGKTNRQSYNKPYTIIFLPDLNKSNTEYIINDKDGTNLINLFYYSSIYSLQTDKNKVTLVGDIGPNYIPDNGQECGPKTDGKKISERKRCGPWSAYVQTGQYLKTNSADNVFFKSINNIDIKIDDKESPHNSLIWNTSQMCPIRNVNLYADSYKNYGSIELGGGVGGWLSDSTIKNIYVSAMGQWMASQENYCFKNLKFNKLGAWRGHADAANIGNKSGVPGQDHSKKLNNFDNYNLGETSKAYKSAYKDSSSGGITLNPNACWTRYTNGKAGASDMSNGCPGQMNFCFLNCKNQKGEKINDDNFLTTGGQRICEIAKKNNVKIQAKSYNGATRTNGPNVIENSDNNYNKPFITAQGIKYKDNYITNYKIISNDIEFATFFKEGGQIENTIYIVLSNIYNFNNKEYKSLTSFNINQKGITLLGLGFSIIKCKNTENGINILNDNITLTNLILDCPDIENRNLQNSVINISGSHCEIYDVTVRTILRCPKSPKSLNTEPFPYSNTEDYCLPAVINVISSTDNIIPVGAASMILVNGDSCYLENIWLWRGDHWNWGGFIQQNQTELDSFNICPFGIIVTRLGKNCKIVQASIEHHSLSSVIWFGDSGTTLAVQGEVAYYNFGQINKIGQGQLLNNFTELFLPSKIENFGTVPTQKINWNYGIWEDYPFKFPTSSSTNKSSLNMRDIFYNTSTKILLKELTNDQKKYLLNNIYNQSTGVYYVIISDKHICNGAGFYSLFNMGGSSRYPLYIDSQFVDNTIVKNAYISGWANYPHGSTTIWDAIYLTNNGQKIGSSVDLASAVYLCDINSLKNGEQLITFTRDEIVSDSSKGNASLINLSQTPGFKIGL